LNHSTVLLFLECKSDNNGSFALWKKELSVTVHSFSKEQKSKSRSLLFGRKIEQKRMVCSKVLFVLFSEAIFSFLQIASA